MFHCSVFRLIVIERDAEYGCAKKGIRQCRHIDIPFVPYPGLELRWSKEDEEDELDDITDKIHSVEWQQRSGKFVINVDEIDVSDEDDINLQEAIDLYDKQEGWERFYSNHTPSTSP